MNYEEVGSLLSYWWPVQPVQIQVLYSSVLEIHIHTRTYIHKGDAGKGNE